MAAKRPRAVTWRAPWRDAPSGAAGRSPRGDGSHKLALIYLNRLSDLLFVLARVLARREQGTEILWDRSRI